MIQRLFQALPVFFGELHVDGQQHLRLVAVRNADGKLHALAAPLFDGGVADILIRRKDLVELRAALRFTHAAARPHIGQHALQIADADGQLLHFAEARLHVFEALGHHAEALRQPPLEGRVQLLVHRRPHLFELRRVALLQRFQPPLHGLPQSLLPPLVRLRQGVHLPGDFRQAALHLIGQLVRVLAEIAAQLTQRRLDGFFHRQSLSGLRCLAG